ncbi:MAG: hypothetical protein WAM74_22925, partial [Xanthobacteraceae bacterium]
RGQQPIDTNPGHYVFSLTADTARKRIHIGISAPNHGICRFDCVAAAAPYVSRPILSCDLRE